MTRHQTFTVCFDRPYFFSYSDGTFRTLEGRAVAFSEFPRHIRHGFAEDAFRFSCEGYTAHGVGRYSDPEGQPVRRQDLPEGIRHSMEDAETLWLDCWDC